MNIFFRTDANSSIGMGHVMRCLSIADAYNSLGNESMVITFILADDTVERLIQSRGYKTIVLHSKYSKMEGELPLWNFRSLETIYLLIVDSYYVTEYYLSSLRELIRSQDNNDQGGEDNDGTDVKKGKLVYIDDINAFPYPVDILINYNTYALSVDYEEMYAGSDCHRKSPVFILGPTYAPLRSMFRGLERKVQNRNVVNILISTGGSDELHLMLSILDRLCAYDVPHSSENGRIYHFLLGAMNTDKRQIRLITQNKDFIVLHENVTDMKSLIAAMDLCISAAGSTLYEICACGVPLITYSLADNQVLGAEAFSSLGLAVNVGDLRNPDTIDSSFVMSGKLDDSAVERILIAIDDLSLDYEKRCETGERMQSLIDGRGADRMVEMLQFSMCGRRRFKT